MSGSIGGMGVEVGIETDIATGIAPSIGISGIVLTGIGGDNIGAPKAWRTIGPDEIAYGS